MNETIPLLTKLFAGFTGMVGGISVSMFWMPESMRKKSELVAGILIGGMSMAASFSLAGIVVRYLEIPPTDTESIMGIGYLIGLVSIGTINFLAKFFDHREDQDIMQVAQEIRKATPRQRTKRAAR
jgi:formate hydrogenlyase subunit 3/multisubunit Na+/H+ antiporter MnhD subunit